VAITAEDFDDLVSTCQSERRFFIENYLWIKTKDRQVISLDLNEAQLRLIAEVEKQERSGKPVRGIIVKPRQVGFTTAIQSMFFHACSLSENTNALTVAHDLDASTEIFGMDRLFLDKLPSFLRPLTRFSNRKEIVFENGDIESRTIEPGLRSQLRVATANDEELGRSKTIHLLHRSERAFWQNQAETLLSVSQAVPDLPGTMIFDESTPNGFGDQFHKDYRSAKEGTTDFFAFFMPWFEHTEYRRPVLENIKAFEDSLDDEERELRKAYNLNLDQLNWRRWAIPNKCGHDPDKFRQEYPSNDVECFLLSGRPRFDRKKLQQMLLAAHDPPFRGYLKSTPDNILHTRLEENASGYVSMWTPPKVGHAYLLSADVAEGLEKGDFSSAHVLDREDLSVCAEWHGHIDPDLFAEELAMLGNLYNTAIIGCEDNFHGSTVNRALRRLGYPNLYYRMELDDRGSRKVQKLGWRTDMASRPIMIDDLAALIREGFNCPSKETVEELMSFIVKPDGRAEAEASSFDDRVISAAIGVQLAKTTGLEGLYANLRRR
jgi:hypothetical protein